MVIEEEELKNGFHDFIKSMKPIEETPIKYTGSELFVIQFQKRMDETFFVIGQVYNDNRFKDGTVIHTSRIESVDWTKGELKTRNTLYKIRK